MTQTWSKTPPPDYVASQPCRVLLSGDPFTELDAQWHHFNEHVPGHFVITVDGVRQQRSIGEVLGWRER